MSEPLQYLIRCLGGEYCYHRPGTCTAKADLDIQRTPSDTERLIEINRKLDLIMKQMGVKQASRR